MDSRVRSPAPSMVGTLAPRVQPDDHGQGGDRGLPLCYSLDEMVSGLSPLTRSPWEVLRIPLTK